MIAVDTNVLLRRVLDDDPLQASKARELFEGKDYVLITDVVLVEAIWTLRSKRYKASRADIALLVRGLLEETNVLFESQQAIWSALDDFLNAPSVDTPDGALAADFSDALIASKAKVLAEQWNVVCTATYTFDRAAQALPGMRSL
jgi:predicted nucleic-acid-binding protein